MDITLGTAMLGVALALLLVLFIVRSNQRDHRALMAQLEPKPARPLTLGSWTRADVAKHASEDDVWIIVQDRRDGKHKVRWAAEGSADGPRRRGEGEDGQSWCGSAACSIRLCASSAADTRSR
jgi:hypothetical protein